jgi:hypothetical protein
MFGSQNPPSSSGLLRKLTILRSECFGVFMPPPTNIATYTSFLAPVQPVSNGLFGEHFFEASTSSARFLTGSLSRFNCRDRMLLRNFSRGRS